ncbi:MAG: AI-2E family transporter [Clostridia bacterium]|nr:AI-2E family transporter [Clostridia bacterium]
MIKLISAATPIIIGLFIAYVLNLIMSAYEKLFKGLSEKNILKKASRILCLIAAIVSLLGIIALIVYLVVPELVSCVTLLISETPKYIKTLLSSDWIHSVLPESVLTELNNLEWSNIINNAADFIGKGLGDAATAVIKTMTSVVSGTITTFIGIFFSVYILLQKEKLSNQIDRLADNYLPSKLNSKLSHILSVLNGCFRRYIVGQCTEAVILGVLCTLGMLIFRFPHAVMIGVLIGFTALIPIVGAYVGGAIGAIIILTQSPIKALLFIVFLVVLQLLEGNFIYPKVVGDSIGLPALWVLTAITLGGALFGVLGMLIGVPLVATIYSLWREDLHRREKAKQPPVSE